MKEKLRLSSQPKSSALSSITTDPAGNIVGSSSTQLGTNREGSQTTQTPPVSTVRVTTTVSVSSEQPAATSDSSSRGTQTSSRSAQPTRQAIVKFCDQSTCQGNCFNQTDVGLGKCYQLGRIGSAITLSLDADCGGMYNHRTWFSASDL